MSGAPEGSADVAVPVTGVGTIAAWVVAVLMWLYYLTPLAVPGGLDDQVRTALSLGPPALALAVLVVRRRHPVAVALVIGVLLLVSPGVIGAAFVAQATVARWSPHRAVVLLSGGWLVAAKLLALLAGPSTDGWDGASGVEMTIATAGLAIATLIGWLAGSRAAESRSRADVDAARRTAEESRLEHARLAERARIAREMHDVLAHRLSLVAMHAGVLAFREDLDAATTRDTARLIQRNTQASLGELRGVLSTLRDTEAPPEPPQPTLRELSVLVSEVREGQPVELDLDVDASAVPDTTSRHAFRIVQEALTNARKHAPGAPVSVQLTGGQDAGLTLRVSNPLTDLALRPGEPAGPGFGLIGVAERAASLGGRSQHETVDGRFALEVFLPWKEES